MVKIFSSVKRMFLCPFSACHRRRCFALVCQISFKAGLRRCPFEWRCVLMCRSSMMRHDLIGSICSAFGTWSSVSRAEFSESTPYCFDSGCSPHTFQASWPSPVFNPPEFLIMFNCWIDEHSWNFHWFYESEKLRMGFSAIGKGNCSHKVVPDTPLHVDAVTDEQTALAQVPEGTVVQKQPSLQPSCHSHTHTHTYIYIWQCKSNHCWHYIPS